MDRYERMELESELDNVESDLEYLYDVEEDQKPFVDDRVYGEIYALQVRRNQILRALGLQS